MPIYLDSIGTILVGALAGPIPGALTGLLANLIWTYVLPAPFHSDYAAPFAIVAAEIGLLAGIFGRAGFFRSRPNSNSTQLVVGGVISLLVLGVLVVYGILPQYTKGVTFFGDLSGVSAVLHDRGIWPRDRPGGRGRRVRSAPLRPARSRGRVHRGGRSRVRRHLGDHLGADLGGGVRRRDRQRH